MIWILGASGYIGKAFVTEAKRRKLSYKPISRRELDYTNFRTFLAALKRAKPDFVVNAAGFTGKPNVDACENQKGETVAGNVTLAQTVASACDVAGVQLGFVSSGCIYTGAKVRRECGTWAVEHNLNDPLVTELLSQRSERVAGFSEGDEPNFCFTQDNCSFYSGTKALAEEAMKGFPDFYVWRLRIPFDEFDGHRNYLSKVQRYAKVYQNWNSVSHRSDFAAACLDSLIQKVPAGVFNIVNPGYISTQEVVEKIRHKLKPKWSPDFWQSDDEFYRFGALTPRANCILDSSKLLNVSVKMRSVDEALEDALSKWKTQ
ncbi:MAG: NAD-dependent epimerase/dehydratase family protein [Proteobacteria bacterium]|nr:NAD-dependent epimerase/dehydratase family protein [Pseudomonadota bacterium]NBS06012.1 NAD-dependent epimerase/dehydratase family protein [Verrucomicrobiota bacterium]NBS49139.1 NAD-dependent epimerase/dehydratase family protein [Verrucomicrobiota bacterium]NBS78452.1 NAD-dependent epimerase/dehydratase family protein [bacterium]